MLATIKTGKNTENHKTTLEVLGYKVADTENGIAVEVTEAIEGEFNATKANLKALIAEKKCLTYKTKIHFEDGTTRSSILACSKLGALSALIMKPEEQKKEETPKSSLFDISDLI